MSFSGGERRGLFIMPVSSSSAVSHVLGACGKLAQNSDSVLDLAQGQFGSTRIGSQLIAALMYGCPDAIDKPIVCLDKGVSFLH